MAKNDPDVTYIKGSYPEIVGQFEVKLVLLMWTMTEIISPNVLVLNS